MMGTVHALRMPELFCDGCGLVMEAGCNCGVGYMPAGKSAARVVARERDAARKEGRRQKSTSALAAESGLSEPTLRRARKATSSNDEVEGSRAGLDGKVRKPRKKVSKKQVTQINGLHRDLMGFLDKFSRRLKAFHAKNPDIDETGKSELMQALYLCSDGLQRLSQMLDGR